MATNPLDVATVYIAYFAPRSDVYQHWVADLGWRPVREPLTPEIVIAGLTKQGPSIGSYMIAPDNTSHVLALDFDTDNGLEQAFALARTMTLSGLPAYVEPSRRGGHLWAVLDQSIPAVAARFAIHALLAEAGLPTDDPKIELRPGSDTISEGGLGHALRLPYMPHPVSGFRGKLLASDGKPLGATLAEAVLAIDTGSRDTALAWSERWKPPCSRIPPDLKHPHQPYPEDTSTASEVLRQFWGVENAVAGRTVKCPSHGDSVPSLTISRDDQRAWCHSPSCVLSNNDRGRGTYELRTLAPAGL